MQLPSQHPSAGSATKTAATPAMAQWFAAKAAQPDALVFFRMGDFYELFFEDAEAAAAALDIALTHRGTHADRPIPMCGVPVHAAEAYLQRLIRRGFRVAIAEQMEPPGKGRAPIRREVVRLVTPGTLTEDTLLEAARPNWLLALAPEREMIGAAWLDISTGQFETTTIPGLRLAELLARLDPAEILAPEGLLLETFASRRAPAPAIADAATARRRVAAAFNVANLEAFGSFTDAEAVAAAVAIDYVRATQSGRLPRLSRPIRAGGTGRLEMDAATAASLEILRARDGGSAHTLLAAVRRTRSAAGARLLESWLAAPLADVAPIESRQQAWRWLLAQPQAAGRLREALRSAPDMARALSRLSLGRGSPRDLLAIRDGIRAAHQAASALTGAPHMEAPALLADAARAMGVGMALHDRLATALAEPAPPRLEPGAIAQGFDGELDAERRLRDDSRRVIAGMQTGLAQRYGVAGLKIRHHAQLGYVIEVPAAATEKLRAFPELALRQGMANGARFTAPELSELDRRITEAEARAASREAGIFRALVEETLAEQEGLAACAAALAEVDALQSAASLAESGTWCCPQVTDTAAFRIAAGRHPVVEAALAENRAAFIPNDCDLSPGRRLLLLTGPNMAGKSTFLRQNALAVVLAQAGLPVPAKSALIGLVDRLFSRVGGADDLARGRSTFMVEMTETAAFLHQAGPRSLVIVDEIGRGTATLDGLAIAWAVLEALHHRARCRTIFATHFHELAELGAELAELSAHAMRVREWKGEVVFLHEVAPGAAGRSWGVQVARLAGVPEPVLRRASEILAALEARAGKLTEAAALPLFAASPSPSVPAPATDPLSQALAGIDPDRLSPREALDALYRLKSLAAAGENDPIEKT
ncbi:MAG: DNA mismatch repair protein MutS [Rhodospirillales bacterium]|nr:DNA mismatch repair protein MutS [Rhodospirillales bacterium]